MKESLSRLFSEGFRIFFLSAGVFGLLSVIVWEFWLGVVAVGGTAPEMPFAQLPQHWHAHEMIFGYATAALGGFFLTAVPSWTGAKAARRGFIAAAVAIWMAGRVAMWMSGSLPPLLVALADLAFLPVLATKILTQLLKRPKPQNLLFLGLLALLWSANLSAHLYWAGLGGPGAEAGLRAGLLALVTIISVLGGRITPAFTRNAMHRAGLESGLPASRPHLDAAGIIAPIILTLLVLAGADARIAGGVALAAGLAELLRLSGWRGLWTLNQPILWSLHLAFAMLGLGFVAFGLANLGFGNEIAALHLLGIGAVGGMTIAVMGRAILGHTGRPLAAPGPAKIAYGLIALSAVLRWVGPMSGANLYWPSMLLSGGAWIAALALFLLAFLPATLAPRASG